MANGIPASSTEVISASDLSSFGYKIGSTLGEGAFGKVFKATKDGKKYAVKMCEDTEDEDRVCNREEAAILKAIFKSGATDYLLSFMESFSHGSNFVIVTEELGMSLYEKVIVGKSGPLQPQKIKTIMNQILLGLNALLDIGYAHLDIKLANILLCKGKELRVKICDFGGSYPVKEIADVGTRGTLNYWAPETVLGLPYSLTTDIWSLGCVFFALFTGFQPFQVVTQLELLQQFMLFFDNFPKELQPMLDRALHKYPNINRSKIDNLFWTPNNEQGWKDLTKLGYCSRVLTRPSAKSRRLEETLVDLIETFLQPAPSKRPDTRKALLLLDDICKEV